MKRKAVIFLCFLLIAPLALAACASSPDATAPEGEGEICRPWAESPRDLGGHEFVFIVRDSEYANATTNEVYAAQKSGDRVSAAVYRRNARLEERFHCTIREERAGKNVAEAVKESLMAGIYCCDFIYGSLLSIRSLACAGLLADLNTVEALDLEKSWWDHNFSEGLEIRGKLFCATGDAGTADERAAWIVLFNREILRENGCADPYELVTAGEWTVEKMYELGEKCWSDGDGDGVYSPDGEDAAAYIAEGNANWVHAAACGARLTEKDASGDFTLPDRLSEDLLRIWEELRPLLTDPHRHVPESYNETSAAAFLEGGGAFYGINCGAVLMHFADAAMDFGILPFPKRSAGQAEYLTSVMGSIVAAYAIPLTADHMPEIEGFENGYEVCGYFLEAFAYASRSTLTPAFYDQLLRKQSVRDADSIDMLDLALKNKVYDPASLFNFGVVGSIFKDAGASGGAFFPAVGNDVNYYFLASIYESRLAAARKGLARYLDLLDVDTNA